MRGQRPLVVAPLKMGHSVFEKCCQCGETAQISFISTKAGGFAWRQRSPALHHVYVAVVEQVVSLDEALILA